MTKWMLGTVGENWLPYLGGRFICYCFYLVYLWIAALGVFPKLEVWPLRLF
jgi:hypothetical protein